MSSVPVGYMVTVKLNETELEYKLSIHLTFIIHSIYLNITIKEEADLEGWEKSKKKKRK